MKVRTALCQAAEAKAGMLALLSAELVGCITRARLKPGPTDTGDALRHFALMRAKLDEIEALLTGNVYRLHLPKRAEGAPGDPLPAA